MFYQLSAVSTTGATISGFAPLVRSIFFPVCPLLPALASRDEGEMRETITFLSTG